LFWGLRGGGGNFGIVTSFEYQVHPVGPTVLAGMLLYPLDQAARVLAYFRDYVAEAPDEVGILGNLRLAPPLPAVPPALHGKPVVAIVVCYAGDRGEAVVKPLREFGTPLVDAIAPRRYTELQQLFNAAVPHGWHYHWRSWELPPLTDAAIDTLVEQAARITSPRSYIILRPLGGAIARVAPDATAYPHRAAPYVININGVDDDPAADDEVVAWTREAFDALTPFSTGGVYVNFVGNEGEDRVRAAYGQAYARLAEIKARYDPDNVFSTNQNVRPAAATDKRSRRADGLPGDSWGRRFAKLPHQPPHSGGMANDSTILKSSPCLPWAPKPIPCSAKPCQMRQVSLGAWSAADSSMPSRMSSGAGAAGVKFMPSTNRASTASLVLPAATYSSYTRHMAAA